MTNNNSSKQIDFMGIASNLLQVGTKVYDKVKVNQDKEQQISEDLFEDKSTKSLKELVENTHDDKLSEELTDNPLDDKLSEELTDDPIDEDDLSTSYEFENQDKPSLDTFGTVANTIKKYVKKNLNTKKAVRRIVKDMISDVDPDVTNENSDQISSLLFKYFDEHYNINYIGNKLVKRTLDTVDVETVIAKNVSVTKIVKNYAQDNWSNIAILFSIYVIFQYILFCVFSSMHS